MEKRSRSQRYVRVHGCGAGLYCLRLFRRVPAIVGSPANRVRASQLTPSCVAEINKRRIIQQTAAEALAPARL